MKSPKTSYHRLKSLNARMAANYRRGKGPTRADLEVLGKQKVLVILHT